MMVLKKTSNPQLTFVVIVISLFVAAMLNVYPLSPDIAKFRPMFLITVLLFWSMYKPRYVGLVATFGIGLFADLLFDTLLGQQAFCVLIASFFVRLGSQYIKQLGFVSSWVLASVCLVLFQGSLFMLQIMTQTVFMKELGGSLLTSILLWPVLMWLLQKFR